MKKFLKKKLALFLAVVLFVPIIWNQNNDVVMAAATPSFKQTKVEIAGIGETFKVDIKNKVAKSKYSWTTSSKSIAKVTKSGIVTSVSSGTATIKCKITYPNKKTKTLSCKVTVIVPATEIEIMHDNLENNTYRVDLDDSATFKSVITPSNSTDKAYWYIDMNNEQSDPSCISLTNASTGTIKGLKAGKAVLRVKAAKAVTQTAADASDIDDTIIIEVVAPTATVSFADITSSNQLTIKFDSPIQKSTVINLDGTLSSNITVTLGKNIKNVLAKDPGKLTPSLSSDRKTLTITAEKVFEGTYGINVSNKVLTAEGVAVVEYNKQITYADNEGPKISSVTYDDTGMIATIHFNEAVDFTDFVVKDPIVIPASSSVDSKTIGIISKTSNYVPSVDKMSVVINLTSIAPADYGKRFNIKIVGIKDLYGNIPESVSLQADLQTETDSSKPQAKVISITRTGYYTVTATFDRAIQSAGYIQIGSGASIYGTVDASNTKNVNYIISSSDAQYSGIRTVLIGHWNSYHVYTSDKSAEQIYSWVVDFTPEITSPYSTSNVFDPTTNILTLTYSESVTTTTLSGTFAASLRTTADDLVSGINISYVVVSHNLGDNIVQLRLAFNSTKTGDYTFSIPQGFAMDSFRNMSVSRAIVINTATELTELSGPTSIKQSVSNLSEITLLFANKLDVASAETISNYRIAGVTILKAKVMSNDSDLGATVILTVQDGSIDATAERPIIISGVKGYNNSYTAIVSYSQMILLKDNLKPYFSGPPIFDAAAKNVIKLNFSEAIQGTLTVTVTQIIGTTSLVLTNTINISGNCAYITLGAIPTNGSYLRIDIGAYNITDVSGNTVTFASTSYQILASY